MMRIGWANAVTLARLAMAPALAFAIVADYPWFGFILFWAACASDFADGGLARRLNEASDFGGLLDHATDAIFVTSGYAALAWRGLVPWALPVLIALAFLQYMIDSRAMAGRPLRTHGLGRWNGIAYYALLGTPIIRDALGVFWPWDSLVWGVGALITLFTAVSMGLRARAVWQARQSIA